MNFEFPQDSALPIEVSARPVEEFQDSIGVCAHFSGPCEKELDFMEEAGIRLLREEMCWVWVEKEKGELKIPEEKLAWIHEANKRGIRILMILNYGNPVYPDYGIGSAKHPDQEFQIFRRYVDFAVRELKDYVHAWEIWNEPNLFFFNGQYGGDWRGGNWTKHFARLSDKTLEDIRKLHEEAKVYTAGMEAPIADLLIPHLKGEYDAIAVHPYCHPLMPEYPLGGMERLRRNAVQHGHDVPFIITEQGYPTISGKGKFMWGHSATLSEKDQARFLLRSICGNFMRGIPRTYWYDLVCDGTDTEDQEHNFGILHHRAESTRPAYEALKKFHTVLSAESDPMVSGCDEVRGRNVKLRFDPAPSSPPRAILLCKNAVHYYLILWKESGTSNILTRDGNNASKRPFHDNGDPENVSVSLSSFSAGRMNAAYIDPVETEAKAKKMTVYNNGLEDVMQISLKESPVIIELTFS